MSKSFKTEKQRMNKLMKKMIKTVQDFKKKIEEKNNSGNGKIQVSKKEQKGVGKQYRYKHS